MIMKLKYLVSVLGLTLLSTMSTTMGLMDPSITHPLGSLTSSEHEAIVTVLQKAGQATNLTLYAQVSLLEPPKADVKAFQPGDAIPRQAVVYMKEAVSFYKAIVDIAGEVVVSYEMAEGQGMWINEEYKTSSTKRYAKREAATLHNHPDVVAGLALRGLDNNNSYCYPLSTRDYDLEIEEGRRIARAPCWGIGNGTNGMAFPVEGLVAYVDMYAYEVLEVIDNGVTPINTDEFGFSEELLVERFGALRSPEDRRRRNLLRHSRKTKLENRLRADREKAGYRKLQVAADATYTLYGDSIEWDIWKFHYRFDMRQGHMVQQVMVNDMGVWREVMYSAMLSEVFVPYMDPDDLWWFRTYMDVGEYGFGLSYTPLTPGIDCPPDATYMPQTLHDSFGMGFEVPDSICLFERYTGDPAWRHYTGENGTLSDTGRGNFELVLRGAATIGNYDYLLDYVFKKDGVIKFAVGATGQDVTKGVEAASTMDPTYEEDTMYGTLLAPNLVGPNHDHFFNFRLDLDVDGQDNSFVKAQFVRQNVTRDIPRKSIWTVEKNVIKSEIPARTQIDAKNPAMYLFGNTYVQGYLDHTPMYRLDHKGSYACSLLSEDDSPLVCNAYVENQVWVTPYDPEQIYSGGEYVYQSNGTDTLKTWTEADRSIHNTDIVVWYTLGFLHHPRMEDWPVMPTKWVEFQLTPFNFFGHNPAITVAPTQIVEEAVAVARADP